ISMIKPLGPTVTLPPTSPASALAPSSANCPASVSTQSTAPDTASPTASAPDTTACPTAAAPWETASAPAVTASPTAWAPLATASPTDSAPLTTACPTASAPLTTAEPTSSAPCTAAFPPLTTSSVNSSHEYRCTPSGTREICGLFVRATALISIRPRWDRCGISRAVAVRALRCMGLSSAAQLPHFDPPAAQVPHTRRMERGGGPVCLLVCSDAPPVCCTTCASSWAVSANSVGLCPAPK